MVANGRSTPFCWAREAEPVAERGGLRRDLPLLVEGDSGTPPPLNL